MRGSRQTGLWDDPKGFAGNKLKKAAAVKPFPRRLTGLPLMEKSLGSLLLNG